jgi:hypothetical protein
VLEKQPRCGLDDHPLRLFSRELLPGLDGLHVISIAF